MTRNVAAIVEVADWIDTHPHLHDQRYWASQTDCGTAFCVAGVRAHLDGWHPLVADGELVDCRYIAADTGTETLIADHAKQRLGLTENEAAFLFSYQWQPAEDGTVGDALRRFAAGEPLLAVTDAYLRDGLLAIAGPDHPLVVDYRTATHS
jgi:hypothetical protein